MKKKKEDPHIIYKWRMKAEVIDAPAVTRASGRKPVCCCCPYGYIFAGV